MGAVTRDVLTYRFRCGYKVQPETEIGTNYFCSLCDDCSEYFHLASLVAIHGSWQPLCQGPVLKVYTDTSIHSRLTRVIYYSPTDSASDIDTTALHCNSGVIIFARYDLPAILLMTAARHPRKVIFNERYIRVKTNDM